MGGDADPFRHPEPPPPLERALPLVRSLPRYGPGPLRGDALAGVTVAALAVPSAMAYAELAGLSPVSGLYALLLPVVAYALLGSARRLVIGPESTVALLVGTTLASFGARTPEEFAALAAMLSLLTAGFFLLARVARLGWVADYLSRPVLIGYIHGVIVVLLVGQTCKMLGIPVDATTVPGQVADLVRGADQADLATAAVGLLSLAALLGLRRAPAAVPGPLLVLAAGIAVSAAAGLADEGVAVVGHVPSGLPDIDVPRVEVSDLSRLVPAALGVFLVSFADEILTARAFAGRRREAIDPQQELLAMGAAHAAAGVTQGFPLGSSGSRTAVNDQVGASSQVSSLVAVAVVGVVLLALTGPMEFLPSACLGAVIAAAALALVDVPGWRALWRVDRAEVAIAVATVLGVVLLGVLQALAVAVGLSIVDAVRRSARPRDAVLGWVERLGRWGDVRLHASAVTEPGVVVYRLDDRLFFANAEYVASRVREAVAGAAGTVRWVVFDAEAMTHVDTTGVEALRALIEELREHGIAFAFARLHSEATDALAAGGVLALVGQANLHPTVSRAVAGCRAADGGAA